MKPTVCILRTDGTNCDEELFYAFQKYGGDPEYVHVNQLRSKDKKLSNFQILALPGGFAYGDDVVSGKILAVELMSSLKDQLQMFLAKKGFILGVCNGFQVLVRTGLLPFGHFGQMEATLAQNNSGHLECRWVKLKTEKSKCEFLNGPSEIIELCVNHGEGRFFASEEIINEVENQDLVFLRYVDDRGKQTDQYPQNPNGAVNAIAGICDPSGRIIGLMPHPEKFVDVTQHPNWRRDKSAGRRIKPQGSFIFEKMIKYVKEI